VKKFVTESWLVLMLGIVFALLLAGTQTSLQARIEANKKQVVASAVRQVVPDVDRMEAREVNGYQVFRCMDAQGELIGWAVEASGMGFVDKITLVAGLNAEATEITGVKVTENLETPGLGNKIADPQWAGQYGGADATREVTVTKGPASGENEVQAITGATWSSRYTTDIVNEILTEVRPELSSR
jgi:electron transport complex protein RnfG